ncbi:MAG TPA: hypothetical protein VFX28_13235 [Methylomirabilota bacterium]|nr:hypothetical protein [Methylomirabilota bacterium]
MFASRGSSRTRWKHTVAGCLGLGLSLVLAAAAGAVPIVINDGFYAGPTASGSGAASQTSDVIGRYADFDIRSITFTQVASDAVTASIRFNYHGGDASLADWSLAGSTMRVGDLLFGAGGGYQYGVALVSHDGLDAGDLYAITGTRSSDSYLAGSGLYWRFGTPVRMQSAGATWLGGGTSSTTNLGGYEVETTLTFAPGGNFLAALMAAGALDVHFASAICANDIIDGSLPRPVPEVGSLLLVGSGLLVGGLVLGRLRLRRPKP